MARSKLTNVVIWKARAVPGQRVIPPHLKLAILSRGRVKLEVPRIQWLVDNAERQGASWPRRLSKPLTEIFSELPVTIELFQKQRTALTSDEIDAAFSGYLELRRRRHLADCFQLVYAWAPHVGRAELEANLELDLTRLFMRPRVYARPRPGDPYLLLTYVCPAQNDSLSSSCRKRQCPLQHHSRRQCPPCTG